MDGKFLIVDDEQDICFIVAKIVQKEGYTSRAVHNLSKAREILGNQRFELAFLDLHLPDGIGFELIPELRKQNPSIKIIVVSAYEGVEEQKKILEEKVDFFVHKPFGRDNIIEALRRVGF